MAAAALGAVAGDEAAYNAVVDGYLAAKDESLCARALPRATFVGQEVVHVPLSDHGLLVRAD